MPKGLREEEQGHMQAAQDLIPKGLRAERVSYYMARLLD
jgi:hypothetical protein